MFNTFHSESFLQAHWNLCTETERPVRARKGGETAISPFCQCACTMMASHKADKIQFAFSETQRSARPRRPQTASPVALRGVNDTYLSVLADTSGAVWCKFLHDPLFRLVFTSPAPLRLAVTSSRHIASEDSHRHGGRREPPGGSNGPFVHHRRVSRGCFNAHSSDRLASTHPPPARFCYGPFKIIPFHSGPIFDLMSCLKCVAKVL